MFNISEKKLLGVDLFVIMVMVVTLSSNYLLFHSFVELCCSLISIVASIQIFCSEYRSGKPAFFLFGIILLTVAGLDICHLLTYKGMGLFAIDETNVTTQLWLVGRYLFAGGFLVATVISTWPAFFLWTVLAEGCCGVALFMIYHGIFPDTYVLGEGLTQFKVLSEFIVIAMLIVAILRISFRQRYLTQRGHFYLIGAIAILALSEVMFTLYLDVYGVFNLLGHLMKISAYLILLHFYFFHYAQDS